MPLALANDIRVRTFRCGLIVALFAALSACTNDNRTESERISDARASMEAYRYRDAIIEMRNVLLENKNSIDARLILSEALLITGDTETAEKEALRARESGAEPDAYLELLARSLQRNGNHVEVISEIDPDTVISPELASTLRALRGHSLLELGSIEEARAIFDAEHAAAHSIEAQRISLLGKSALARNAGELEVAESFAKQAFDLDPKPESLLALGRILITQSKFADAKALLGAARNETTRARRQDWFFIEAQYIEALLGLGELAAARESTTILTSIGKAHPMSIFLLGRVEFESGNTDRAVDLFQQTLAKYPSYAPALTLMGIAMIQRDDYDQAEMHLTNAVANNPTNVRARRLLAETRLRMGRDRAAVRTLKDGLNIDSTDVDLLTMLGRATIRSGEPVAGLQQLQEAFAKAPNSLPSGLALASAYLSSGNSTEAIKIIQALPKEAIDENRRQVLIKVASLDNNDQTKAEQQIEQLLQDSPGDSFVIGLAGSFYAATGQTNKARAQFNEILTYAPGNRSAMLNILNLDERIDDYSHSQELFEAAHQRNERDLLPTLVLARIYQAQGDQDRAISMVTKANVNDPSALLPNLMLAAEAMRKGMFSEAEQYSEKAVSAYPGSARAHALNGLTKMKLDRVTEAKNSFQRAVLLSPETTEYRYYLGKAAWENGQLLLARSSFAEVINDDSQHVPAKRALGILMARAGKRKQAFDLLTDIQKQDSDSRPALVAIGEIHAALGDYEKALASFEKAQQLRLSWYVAVELYSLRKQHNLEDPIQSLNKWLLHAPNDPRAQLKIAQHFHATGQHELAITEYETVLQSQPDSIVTLNNLAWLYFERNSNNDRKKALGLAAHAYELSEHSANIADTYGWLLYKNDEVQKSRTILRAALRETSARSSPEIAYHYAVVLDDRGSVSAARDVLELALKSEAPFPSRVAAQSLYNRLMSEIG